MGALPVALRVDMSDFLSARSISVFLSTSLSSVSLPPSDSINARSTSTRTPGRLLHIAQNNIGQ